MPTKPPGASGDPAVEWTTSRVLDLLTDGSTVGFDNDISLSLIEGSTLARAIYRLATAPSPGGLPAARWEGTAAELLPTLQRICADAGLPTTELPAGERQLGQKVREIAPALRRAGVDVRPGPRAKNRRPLIIQKTADGAVNPPPPLLS